MLIRSKAPLRLGLAGGGTDVSPYSELYGGAILNATIDLFIYTTIIPRNDNKILIKSIDQGSKEEYEYGSELPINGNLDLIKGVYNRIIREYYSEPIAFTLETYSESPKGSGLGASSALIISVLAAFSNWLNLPFGEYDLAHLAYEIERIDLNFSGGKQDQYSAAFGGINFMEFYSNDKVIVNPLRINRRTVEELEYNTLLYYTDISRVSSKIIDMQVQNVKSGDQDSINAMHTLKQQAIVMKEAILTNHLEDIGAILDQGWENKKKMADIITNQSIDEIYNTIKDAGALGSKISGAGGGGYLIIYCGNKSDRRNIIDSLNKYNGHFTRFHFTKEGVISWKV